MAKITNTRIVLGDRHIPIDNLEVRYSDTYTNGLRMTFRQAVQSACEITMQCEGTWDTSTFHFEKPNVIDVTFDRNGKQEKATLVGASLQQDLKDSHTYILEGTIVRNLPQSMVIWLAEDQELQNYDPFLRMFERLMRRDGQIMLWVCQHSVHRAFTKVREFASSKTDLPRDPMSRLNKHIHLSNGSKIVFVSADLPHYICHYPEVNLAVLDGHIPGEVINLICQRLRLP